MLLAAHIQPRNLFFLIAIPAVIAAISMFILGRRLRDIENVSTAEPVIAH